MAATRRVRYRLQDESVIQSANYTTVVPSATQIKNKREGSLPRTPLSIYNVIVLLADCIILFLSCSFVIM